MGNPNLNPHNTKSSATIAENSAEHNVIHEILPSKIHTVYTGPPEHSVFLIGLFQLRSRSVSRDPLVGRNITFTISFVLQTYVLLPWFLVHSTEFAIESAI